ncbi:uncharacterized protein ACLA_074330 [Aspergillus clavatus NRRL 1]|uniref:Rhodopsin domain-containing protein n=1 Tax=Aspergillus clavatus (strain ATCC 1007 / CBS 513.65 / DSM 816 / NCTC 3887 / NRRL 1 / QM 1276 / 107) TaxID=344612 RepID=A1C7M5_ASPCL|nr:uncharacterized protein ACLA_074330 [Aspergillus clavatus NRRL 1]EAW14396.1 hypothetical protein ACLA_074330 [Aspergillus clavatus NRRL 1]
MATVAKDSLPLEGQSLGQFVVCAVMMSISVLAVLLRSFVRLFLVRAFGWDDALMVIALLIFIALNISCMIGAQTGIGHRMIDFASKVDPMTGLDLLERSLLLWWLNQMLYIWSSAVAKVSIAVALLRLAVRRFHRVTLWTVLGLSIGIAIMFWLVLLFACKPISYFWQRVRPGHAGTCLSTDTLVDISYLYSSLTIFCDLTLGIMPALLVWNLQMNRKTKIALGAILSLGAVASVAVIIRIPFLQTYKDADFLYSTFQIAIWSVIETGLGITAGSLVTLRPLFRWFLDGSTTYGRAGRSGKRSDRQYPLSNMSGDVSKKGPRDPGYWRPDITSEVSNVVVTAVSSPQGRSYLDDAHSSQEDLNPRPEAWHPRYEVNIEKTFKVSEEL